MGMLEELGAYLAAQGVGTVGTDLFLGTMPDTPDAATVLFEAGGGPPFLSIRTDQPAFQVRTRDPSYEAGRTTMESAFAALNGLTETDLSGTRYHLIRAEQSPVALGRDEKQRHEWTCNFRCIRDNPDPNQQRPTT